MIYATTGHRPPKLPGGYNGPPEWFIRIIAQYLQQQNISLMYVGMAMGWDQIVAALCKSLGIPYVACIPFVGQEVAWSPPVQRKYRELITGAKEVVCVTNDRTMLVSKAMQLRNEYMVKQCAKLLAGYDGSPSGTRNTVYYAGMLLKPMDNLWPQIAQRWELERATTPIPDTPWVG